jgi:hypothetical protein
LFSVDRVWRASLPAGILSASSADMEACHYTPTHEIARFGFACRQPAPNVVRAMKIRLPLALFAALLAAGCGKKENVPATVAAAAATAPA